MRAAIFPSVAPGARCSHIITSDLMHVALNTPLGGCAREIGQAYQRPSDVPPLGQLPATQVPAA